MAEVELRRITGLPGTQGRGASLRGPVVRLGEKPERQERLVSARVVNSYKLIDDSRAEVQEQHECDRLTRGWVAQHNERRFLRRRNFVKKTRGQRLEFGGPSRVGLLK